ncbi:MAG TPA: ester cyclase [Dehalococcoidia bacterium]|nr:ester cyclase [Dehalococcoidia bacterium]
MSVAENKAVVRRFYRQVLNGHRIEPLDRLLAAEFVDLGASPGQPCGRDEFKAALCSFLECFPDLRFRIEEQIAEGDRVVTLFSFSAPACGKSADASAVRSADGSGLSIERIVNGKIVTSWLQLGVPGLPD